MEAPIQIRATALKGFDTLCREVDLDPADLLADVGLPEDTTRDSSAFIPYEAYARVLTNAAGRSGLPHFGLLLATHPEHDADVIGPLQLLMRASSTVGALLESQFRLSTLQSHGAIMWLERDGTTALARREPRFAAWRHNATLQDLTLAEWTRLLRVVCGPEWSPDGVYLTHATPANTRPYRETFGCAPYFRQEYQGIAFDAAVLERPITGGNPQRFAALYDEFLQQVKSQRRPFRAHVADGILATLGSGRCSEAGVAALFGVHPRTMHRRLRSEGTTFSVLLAEQRRELAVAYLRHTELSLQRISAALGYSEPAIFTRAFQRWFGEAPSRWRRRAD